MGPYAPRAWTLVPRWAVRPRYHRAMSDLGLSHVALPVRDVAASVAFYERYADLRPVLTDEGKAWIGDGRREFVIVLIEMGSVPGTLAPPGHLGVAVATREVFDERVERARAEGLLLGEPVQEGGEVGIYAFLRDPDGHTLEISHGQTVEQVVRESLAG